MNTGSINVTSSDLVRLKLEHDERWKVALRVAASPEFARSARLREFLLYVCERELTDRGNEIREQVIGAEVFNRRPDYNPGEDNIVRVEARELRKRLDRFFTGKGSSEPFRIRIPKGSYVPVFEEDVDSHALITVAQPESAGISFAESPKGVLSAAKTKSRLRLSWNAIGWITVAAALILTQAGRWGGDLAHGFSALSHGTAPASVWPTLFRNQRPVTIVAADSSLVLVQDLTQQVVPLSAYANKTYVHDLSGPAVSLIMQRPYTSLADAVVSAELLQTAGSNHPSLQVRYARDLNMRDLENGNLVFLGSAYSDPWISEFNAQRNFIMEVDSERKQLYFLNRSPRLGEADRYYAYYAPASGNPTDETYGLITYLPNLRHTGKVLILEGTNSEGTEAAGDFITSSAAGAMIRQQLQIGAKPIPPFQMLIKTSTVDHTPTKLQVVAARTLPIAP